MPIVELQGATNVRDLGGVAVGGGRVVKHGLIYRGDALCKITEADQQLLFGELGIACVVDLRCGWELEKKPDIVAPSVEYLHIPFYDLEKVGIEYTHPAPGTEMQGRDLVCDPDHYYRALANPLTVGQMRKGVNAIFDHAMQGKPTYQHCSGGKDRTGTMALLLLSVLGASREAILEDYLLTNIGRDKNLEPIIQRFTRLTGSAEEGLRVTELHRARPENLTAFYEAVDEGYNGMESFIENQLGIDSARRQEIIAACTKG